MRGILRQICYAGTTLVVALMGGIVRAEEPRVFVRFVASSYAMFPRAMCPNGLVSGVRVFGEPGSPFIDQLARAPCPNQPATEALQLTRLVTAPIIERDGIGSPEAEIFLSLEARAQAAKRPAAAYAGLYKMELGGAWARWRLSNASQRSGLVLVGCRVKGGTTGALNNERTHLVDNVLAEGSVILLDALTDKPRAELCTVPPDDGERLVRADQTARRICLGAGSVIDLKLEGRALARAAGGFLSGDRTSASSEAEVSVRNLPVYPPVDEAVHYVECNAAPGQVLIGN
jgi:hypothetical protein